jgi:hypothetical protein
VTIIEAIADDNLFGRFFKDKSSWAAWIVFLKAVFALPMDMDEAELFKGCTGGRKPPEEEIKEAYVIAGRRAGKSYITAIIAVYLAVFRDYSQFLSPGERATIMVLARDRTQGRVILRYVKAFLNNVLMFSQMIENEKTEELELTNGVNIAIHTSNYRAVRGFTIAGVVLEETAFWRTDLESANPDVEVLRALKPAMLTIPNSKLIAISSPYSRKGILWDAYRKYYGKDDNDVMVWQASSLTMNSTIPKKEIERAYTDDPESAKAEYGAQFRSDIESFISREIVDQCTIPDRFELPPIPGNYYSAFTDPSGGSKDSFTLAIGHLEKGVRILDAIREKKPPFSPDETVKDFADLLKRYRVSTVKGDRYAGEWPRERFRKHRIQYETSEKVKSDLYRDMLPLLNSGEIELLDHRKMINQLVNLERRTARSGKDSIDHGPGQHDDLINVVAGVLVNLVETGPVAYKSVTKTRFSKERRTW